MCADLQGCAHVFCLMDCPNGLAPVMILQSSCRKNHHNVYLKCHSICIRIYGHDTCTHILCHIQPISRSTDKPINRQTDKLINRYTDEQRNYVNSYICILHFNHMAGQLNHMARASISTGAHEYSIYLHCVVAVWVQSAPAPPELLQGAATAHVDMSDLHFALWRGHEAKRCSIPPWAARGLQEPSHGPC